MPLLVRLPLSQRLPVLGLALKPQSIHHRSLATHSFLNPQGTVQLLEDIPNAHVPQIRHGLPAFTLSRARGFLPRDDPITNLPPAFSALTSLLERMTLIQPDGTPGLLAEGTFGQAVISELCNISTSDKIMKAIDDAIANNDQLLLSAL